MPIPTEYFHREVILDPLIYGLKQYFTQAPRLGNPAFGQGYNAPIQASFPHAGSSFEHEQVNQWLRKNGVMSATIHDAWPHIELRLASHARVWSAILDGGTPGCNDPIEGTLFHALLEIVKRDVVPAVRE